MRYEEGIFFSRNQVSDHETTRAIDAQERQMRSFLINKNISFYYWLKRRTGKAIALGLANMIEKVILIFGRERIPSRKIGIRKKVKRWELTFRIRKSILIWKLMNFTHVIR